eukprot:1392389-Amorphochlora_amoeboformis.AAC.2
MPAARRTARSKGSRKNFKQKGLHSECAREPLKNLQSNLASSFRTHGAATPAPGRKKSVSKTGEYRTPDDEEISSLCASQKSGKLRFGYGTLNTALLNTNLPALLTPVHGFRWTRSENLVKQQLGLRPRRYAGWPAQCRGV